MARPSRYPDEFRREAVQMALATQDSRASVARRLTTLASTVENWWPAIEAFPATGITNARTEGLTRLVKQTRRSAWRDPQRRQRISPDTVPPHPETPGTNSGIEIIARSTLKSRNTLQG